MDEQARRSVKKIINGNPNSKLVVGFTDEGCGGDLAPVLVVGVPDEPLRTLAGEVSQVVCAFGPGSAGVQSTLVDVDALKRRT